MRAVVIAVFVGLLLISFERCSAKTSPLVFDRNQTQTPAKSAIALEKKKLLETRSSPTFKGKTLEIEDRSIWDQMNAMARLPGDLSRKDFIALVMDIIILAQFLPLHYLILMVLNGAYRGLKFIHPAYWWLFPSTKPANVKGYGFSKLL